MPLKSSVALTCNLIYVFLSVSILQRKWDKGINNCLVTNFLCLYFTSLDWAEYFLHQKSDMYSVVSRTYKEVMCYHTMLLRKFMVAACAYSLYLQTLSLSVVESHTKESASYTCTHTTNAQGIKYVRFALTERLKRMKLYKLLITQRPALSVGAM